MTWGDHNVDTGAKELYEEIRTQRDDLFPRQYILFQIAAAIGIHDEERKPISAKRRIPGTTSTLFRSSTTAFDRYGVFESLLRTNWPEKSEKERLELLEEFADYGIHVIHDQITKTGTLNLEQYLHTND